METFDGELEIGARLERGASYGMSKLQYGRLAQAAISASRLAGVEPCEIRHLPNGEAGCLVDLYGSHSAYTIKVEARIGRISLAFAPLDSAAAPAEIFSGSDASFEDWYRMVQMMLRLEDFCPMSIEEAEVFLRSQGVDF